MKAAADQLVDGYSMVTVSISCLQSVSSTNHAITLIQIPIPGTFAVGRKKVITLAEGRKPPKPYITLAEGRKHDT